MASLLLVIPLDDAKDLRVTVLHLLVEVRRLPKQDWDRSELVRELADHMSVHAELWRLLRVARLAILYISPNQIVVAVRASGGGPFHQYISSDS